MSVHVQLSSALPPEEEKAVPSIVRRALKSQLAGVTSGKTKLSFDAGSESCEAVAAWLKSSGRTVRLLDIAVDRGEPDWNRPSEEWVAGALDTEAAVGLSDWKEPEPPVPPERPLEVGRMPAADLVHAGFNRIASTRFMEFFGLPLTGGVTVDGRSADGWHRLWPAANALLPETKLVDPTNQLPLVLCGACGGSYWPAQSTLVARPDAQPQHRLALDPITLEHPGTTMSLVLRVKTATTLLSRFRGREGNRLFVVPLYAWDSPTGKLVRRVRETFEPYVVGDR